MAEVQEEVDTRCYHCGDTCRSETIQDEDKTFCCVGCHTVYQLLSENDLCTYYDIEANPGIKRAASIGTKFAYLDHEEVAQRLLSFSEGGTSKITFYVPGIHCSSCIWLLENLHRLHEGIMQVHVHFLRKEVTVTFRDEGISLREVVELMTTIGYEPNIHLDSADPEKKSKKQNRTFYYKLGIAGFAFGNIMLLSFPEYLDVEEFLQTEYKRLFGWLNLVLSLPVFFYSASEYYVSAYKGLRAKYINIDVPVSIGIITLFSRSAYEIVSGTGPGFMDSFAMFVFLLLVGKWYQNRTYQALSFDRDYKSYFPIAVNRLTVEGVEESIPLDHLEIGDRLYIRNREIVPADSILQSERALIDYSFVTGESDPVVKQYGERIYAGGRQVGAAIELTVEKRVSQSYLTQLWNQETFQKSETRMSALLDRVSRHFTAIVLVLAVGSLFFWLPKGTEAAVHVFTSVLIIACPCALALTVPFASGTAMRLLSKLGFYLKNSAVLEKLASIRAVVFDKTGTLTRKRGHRVSYAGPPLTTEETQWVKSLVLQSAHPVSLALGDRLEGALLPVVDFEEVPGKGVQGQVAGHRLRVGLASWIQEKTNKTSSVDTPSETQVEIDGVFRGGFTLEKEYREGLESVLNELGARYELFLLSGDHAGEFDRLRPFFTGDDRLHFRQSPEDKLAFVEQLQQHPYPVLMVGDGLNDAGALRQADVGISMADDIYQFSPACDAILDAGRFSLLPRLMRFSRRTLRIVRASFVLSLAYNTVGMYFALKGLVTPLFAAVLMPLSSVTVVGFVTLATRWAGRDLAVSAPPIKN